MYARQASHWGLVPNRVGVVPGNNGAGTTLPGFYDVLGRRYYAGVRMSF